MPLLTSGDGVQTSPTTIQSLEGKIRLNFTLADGTTTFIVLDSNKLAKEDFTISPGSNRLDNFQILGSGHAITAATVATGTHAIHTSFVASTISAGETVSNGVGKIDFESGNNKNIKNVSSVIGHAFEASAFSLENGAVLFTTSGGTQRTVNDSSTSLTNATIQGGTGVAMMSQMTAVSETLRTPTVPAGTGPRTIRTTITTSQPVESVTSIGSQNAAASDITVVSISGTTITFDVTLSALADAGISAGLDIEVTYIAVGHEPYSSIVRLDEVAYPFTIATSDNLTLQAQGSALIFT